MRPIRFPSDQAGEKEINIHVNAGVGLEVKM
jgi:hypothetical protein